MSRCYDHPKVVEESESAREKADQEERTLADSTVAVNGGIMSQRGIQFSSTGIHT